jgi:pimeloyl-ACP methyl ester carboxylesterase
MPVYMRSRHLDLERLAQVGQLEDHVLFSSGWEWGYWLTDATTLRMNYTRPAKWDDPVKELFAAWGAEGATAAELIRQLAEAQHRAFILEKLTAYIASRDQIIDAGDRLGIFSQPDRPEFEELAAATPEVRTAFKADVVDKLKVHADEVTAIAEASKALPATDPVLAELKDSLEVTAARTRYIHALYAATLAYAEKGNDDGFLAKADADLEAGKEIVARRRRALWDPDPKTILRNTANPTFYQYGYLREGDTLCFWERERAQAKNLIQSAGLGIPGCVL